MNLNHYSRNKRDTYLRFFFLSCGGRRSDAISIFSMNCQTRCWSMHSTDKETGAQGGQVVCPSSYMESLVELGFEPGCPTGSGSCAVHCPGAILTQCPLLLPSDSAGSLRRGDHILNMVLAMHSWVLPSAHLAARLLTLYPPGAMSSGWRAEGRDERAWWGRGEQAGLRCWITEP